MANKALIRGTRMALGLNPELAQTQQDKSYTGPMVVWDRLAHSDKVSATMRMLANEQKRATCNTLHILLNRKWEDIPAVWQDRLYKVRWGSEVLGSVPEVKSTPKIRTPRIKLANERIQQAIDKLNLAREDAYEIRLRPIIEQLQEIIDGQ